MQPHTSVFMLHVNLSNCIYHFNCGALLERLYIQSSTQSIIGKVICTKLYTKYHWKGYMYKALHKVSLERLYVQSSTQSITSYLLTLKCFMTYIYVYSDSDEHSQDKS